MRSGHYDHAMAKTAKFGILVFLIGAVCAGPLHGRGNCAKSCPDNSKYDYETRKTYVFSYNTDVVTSIPGATEEHSSLHMTSSAKVTVLSKCEMMLELHVASLQDSSPANLNQRSNVEKAWAFKRDIMAHPLRFGFSDGVISGVCPSANDPVWVVNIKRGFLSAFQNTMPSLDMDFKGKETDVTGVCDVSYMLVGEKWGKRSIKKTKNLMSCEKRGGHTFPMQSVSYSSDSRIQSLPLLKSTHECKQTISKNNILLEATCEEIHVFRPFSKHHQGASSTIKSHLTFTKVVSSQRVDSNFESIPSTLIFEVKPEHASEDNDEDVTSSVGSLLQSLCSQSVKSHTPGLFSKLVKTMKQLSYNELKTTAMAALKQRPCPSSKNYVIDALPAVATTTGIKVMKELIRNENIDHKTTDLWLTSLAFVKHPDTEMLRELKDVLSLPSRKAALAVSAIVHTYCSKHEKHSSESEVQDIIDVLKQRLGSSCKSRNYDQHENILIALKALGNAGHNERIKPILARCYNNEENDMETRAAAIQAHRRMSCDSDRNDLITLFKNRGIDAELRIHAYLEIMRCPTKAILDVVNHQLAVEEVNQVGSFVWTHLTNLQETSSPLKQELRTILQNTILKRVFNKDARKFSRNMEIGHFSDMLNMGGALESNIMMSSSSFIPRYGNLNLTVDMFGESVNLLEVGGRVEGLESVLEAFLAQKDPAEILRRNRRDVISDNAISGLDRKFETKLSKKPYASLFLRVFGNEIRYDGYRFGDAAAFGSHFDVRRWMAFLAKDHNIEHRKSVQFLDSEIQVPTIAGMPLRLKANGAAVMNLQMKGKMDLQAAHLGSINVEGSVAPSAAMDVTLEMGVCAFMATTGLRMTSRLATDTLLDGKVTLKNLMELSVDFNTPRQKQEIFTASRKFFVLHRADVREQKMITEGRIEKQRCFKGVLTKTLGVELCGDVKLTPALNNKNAPFFPLTAPTSVKVVLNKKDTQTGYHFEAKLTEDPANMGVRIAFDTPGSRVDRALSLDLNIARAAQTARLDLRSPWRRVEMNGALVTEEKMKRITVTAKVDNQREYSLNAEVGIDAKKFQVEYSPALKISLHGRSPVTLHGHVTYREARKLDVDLTLERLTKTPISVKGLIERKDSNYKQEQDVDFSVSSPWFNGKIAGSWSHDMREKITILNIESEYQKGQQNHKVTFESNLRDLSKGPTRKAAFSSSFLATEWSQLSNELSLEFTQGKSSLLTNVELTYSGDKTVLFKMNAIDKSEDFKTNGEFYVKFAVPHKSMEYELDINHLHTKRVIKSSGLLKYAPGKQIDYDVNSETRSITPLSVGVSVKANYPGREMVLNDQLEETKPGVFHHDLTLQTSRDYVIKSSGVFKMADRYEANIHLDIPTYEPIKISAHLKDSEKNFQSKFVLEFAHKQYGFEAMYGVSGNEGIQLKYLLDLIYGEARIQTEGEVGQSETEIVAYLQSLYDANRNPNKRFKIETRIGTQQTAPSVNAKVTWYPDKFVNIEGKLAYATEGWMSSTNDIEARIGLTSSIEGLEKAGSVFKIEIQPQQILIDSNIRWGEKKAIGGKFNIERFDAWYNFKLNTALLTPFKDFEEIKSDLEFVYKSGEITATANAECSFIGTYKVAVKYLLNSNGLDLLGSVHWERSEFTVGVTGLYDPEKNHLHGKLELGTPFDWFKKHLLQLHYERAGGNLNTKFNYIVGREKEELIAFEMDHDNTAGFAFVNKGKLNLEVLSYAFTFNTPYVLDWNVDANHHGINAVATLGGDVAKAYLNADLTDGWSSVKITGKTGLDLPKYYSKYSLAFSHQHEKYSLKNIKSSAVLIWKSDETKIEVSNDLSFEHWHTMTEFFRISTPFKPVDEITIHVNSKKVGDTYTTHKEVKYGDNKKVAVDAEVMVRGQEVDGQIRLVSPCPVVPRLVFSFKNLLKGEAWETTGVLEYQPGQKIELKTELIKKRQVKFNMELKTPWEFLELTNFDLLYKGHSRSFTLATSFNHNKLKNPIQLNMRADSRNLNKLKVQFLLKTQFRAAKLVKLLMTHKRTGPKYDSDLTFIIPGRMRYSAYHTMLIRSATDWRTTTTLNYGQKVSLSSEMKINPRTFANKPEWRILGEITTPYSALNQLKVSSVNIAALQSIKHSSMVTYNQSPMELTADINRKESTVNIELKTPFMVAKSLGFSMKHSGPMSNFKNEVGLEYNGRKITSIFQFKIRSGEKMVAKLNVKTPFRALSSLVLTASNEGTIRAFKFNSELKASSGGKPITAKGHFDFGNRKFNSKFEINTPFPGYKHIIMIAKFDGAPLNHDAEVSLIYHRKILQAQTKVKVEAGNIDLAMNLSIPVNNRKKNVNFTFTHDGFFYDFRNQALLLVNRRRYSAKSSFKFGRVVEGKFELRTPARYGFEFKHRGNIRQNFTTTFSATHRNKVTDLTLQFARRIGHLEASFGLMSHYRNWRNFGIKVKHDMRPGYHQSTGSVMTSFPGHDKYEAKFTQSGTPANLKVVTEIKTPITGYKNYKLIVNHSGARSDFSTSAKLFLSNINVHKPFEVILKHKLNGWDLDTSLTVETPFPSYKQFTAALTHQGSVWQGSFDSKLLLSSSLPEFEKFLVNVNFNGDITQFTGKTEVTTPIPGYETFAVIARHSVQNRLKEELEIKTPFASWERLVLGAEYERRGAGFLFEGKIVPPTNVFRQWGCKVEHTGQAGDFKTELSMDSFMGPTGKYAAILEFKKVPGSVVGDVIVLTPIEGHAKYEAKFSHRGDLRSFNTEFAVMTPLKKHLKYGFDVNHRLHGNGFITEATLNFPLDWLRNWNVKIEHSGVMLKSKTNGRLGSPFGNMNFEFENNAEPNRPLSIRGLVKTSWGFLNQATINIYDDRYSEMTGKLVVTVYQRQSEASVSVKASPHKELRVKVTTPYRGYESFVAESTFQGTKQNFNADGRLETPFNAFKNFDFSIKHAISIEKYRLDVNAEAAIAGSKRVFAGKIATDGNIHGFSGTGFVNFDNERVSFKVNHRGYSNDFSSSGEVTYKDNTAKGSLTFKRTASDYATTLKLDIPFLYMDELEGSWEHNVNSGRRNGKLVLKKNEYVRFSGGYEYNLGGRNVMEFYSDEPAKTKISLKWEKTPVTRTANLEVNWDKSSPNKYVKVDLRRHMTPSIHDIKAKVTLPWRVVAYESKCQMSPNRYKHMGIFQWDYGSSKKAEFNIDASQSQSGAEKRFEGTAEFKSLLINAEIDFKHRCTPGRNYLTELNIKPENLKITHTLNMNNAPTFKSIVKVTHPKFTKNALFTVEATNNLPKVLQGKLTVDYEREHFQLFGGISDESRSEAQKKYVSQFLIKHPRSKTDIAYHGSFEHDDENCVLDTKFNYKMSRNLQNKVNALKVEINRIKRELNAQIESPLTGLVRFNARQVAAVDGKYRYSASANVPRRKTVRAEAELNLEEMNGEAKLHYGAGKMLHLYAKYLTPSDLQLEVYRLAGRNRVTEALASLKLTGRHLLKSRVYFRPQLYKETKQWAKRKYSTIGRDLFRTFRPLIFDLKQKFRSLSTAGEPFKIFAQTVMQNSANKWGELASAFKQMYDRDEFFIKTTAMFAVQAAKKAMEIAEIVFDYLDKKMEELEAYAVQMLEALSLAAQRVWDQICHFGLKIKDFALQCAYKMVSFVMETKNFIVGMYDAMATHLGALWDAFKEYIVEYLPYLETVKKILVKQWNGFVSMIKEIFNRIAQNPAVSAIAARINAVKPMDYIHPIRSTYNVMTSQSKESMQELRRHVNILLARPEMKYVKMAANRFLKHGKYLYDYLEVDSVIDRWLEMSSGDIYTRLLDVLNSYFHFDKNRVIVWDPKQGEFQAQVYIPFELRDLQSLPTFTKYYRYYERLQKLMSGYNVDDGWVLWDTFYKYKPKSLNVVDWLPPFPAHGTIAGTQHFITFDGKMFEFAGECSYLLTRDFVDGNFSVVINYSRQPGSQQIRKTLTVISDGKQVEIAPGKVYLNGKKTQLPLQFGRTAVVQEASSLTVSNLVKGFQLTCDLMHDICTVNVTGWYFGKTGGLFGTYNNEIYDETKMSNNVVADDIPAFAQSWAVGRRCRGNNIASGVTVEKDTRRYKVCAALFESGSSQYRPCFRQVEPAPFMQMCLNDLPLNRNEIPEEADTCNVGALYVQQCSKAGVSIRLPKTCVTCEMERGIHSQEGETVTLDNQRRPGSLKRQADVVLVVQDAQCNKNVILQLKRFLDHVEKAMRGKGIVDVRYALVTYGGKDQLARPYPHTMDGQLFTEKSRFYASPLKFSLQKKGAGDGMEAVHYAAKLPFRAGVSKSMLLLPCSSCAEEKVSYLDVQQLLLNRDIRLHVLLQKDFEMRSKSAKAKRIYGADHTLAYTMKDLRSRKLGDADMRKSLMMPKDLCVALSEESNGTVFNMNKFISKKTYKKFVTVLAKVIAHKAEPSSCQICDCMSDSFGRGVSVCRPCVARNPLYHDLPFLNDELYGSPYELGFSDAIKKPSKPRHHSNKMSSGNFKELSGRGR